MKARRGAELRSPEGPHDVLSMALPQPMSNRETKVTRGKEPDLTSNRRPPPYKMEVEVPPAYMVKQGRQDALATIRRTITLPRIPAFSDVQPAGITLGCGWSTSQAKASGYTRGREPGEAYQVQRFLHLLGKSVRVGAGLQ